MSAHRVDNLLTTLVVFRGIRLVNTMNHLTIAIQTTSPSEVTNRANLVAKAMGGKVTNYSYWGLATTCDHRKDTCFLVRGRSPVNKMGVTRITTSVDGVGTLVTPVEDSIYPATFFVTIETPLDISLGDY